jgi:hypothetical protein
MLTGMNPQEKLQRLLKTKAAFPEKDSAAVVDSLLNTLPFRPDEHARAERGLASESRFADVFSALDWAPLIHGLDQWQLPLASKTEWHVPDYTVFVRTPNREAVPVLIEVKLASGQKETFEISSTLLETLQRYAETFRLPLLIAIFWQKLHLWTTHTPDQLTRTRKAARIKFDDAIHCDVSVIFSDTLFLISKDWRRRTTYDPDAEGFHLRDSERGFVVEDYLAIDGNNFVELTEVESGIISKIMRPKVIKVERNGKRSVVSVASTRDSVAKASSIVQLLLEQFDAFGEESAPERAFNTLARLKLNAKLPIHPLLPNKVTAEVEALFDHTFGIRLSGGPVA